MNKLIALILLNAATTLTWSQAQLSPKQIGGGALPSNVQDMVFTVGNGNWVGEVVLPKTGLPNATIKVVRTSLWGASVLQNNASNIPVYSMYLPEGVPQTYKFSTAKNQWEFTSAYNVAVINSRQPLQVAATESFVSRVYLKDGRWVPNIVLPERAPNGALVIVKSDATWASLVAPKNVLHERRMRVKRGDEYVFEYLASIGKWSMSKGPQTVLKWGRLIDGNMPIPDYPKTLLTIPDDNGGGTIRLPNYGSNRDHLIITSNANKSNTISAFGVRSPGTMKITKGQTYEFMWLTSTHNWERVKTAQTILKLNDLPSDLLPDMTTPITEVIALEGSNAKTSVTLPSVASDGDRVIFKSTAPGVIKVYGAKASDVGSNLVDQNEEVTFAYKAGTWSRETYNVRMLLIHGTNASASIGVNAMKSRLAEGLRVANKAMSDSGATVRLQSAGFMQHQEKSLNAADTLKLIRGNQLIQTERNLIKADAIYFEGKFSGVCGLGWINTFPNADYMSAVGNSGCGTGIMTHEIGHNMGLPHNGPSVNSVMSTTYGPKSQFANPKIITLPLGVALGFDSTNTDEVKTINSKASAVSRFR